MIAEEKDKIEAIYEFIISDTAAVCGFEATIDKRKVIGIVKEAEQAKNEYKEAINQGCGAYLLEEQDSGIFKCSVGNIMPRQKVEIKIKYVIEIQHDAGTDSVRFILPATIAPKYGSYVFNRKNHSTDSDYFPLEFTIICRMSSQIDNEVEGPRISKVTLNRENLYYLENDFILLIKSRNLGEPRVFIEYNPITDTNCLMLTLVPTFECSSIKHAQTNMELIFMIDSSKSMKGANIEKTIETLQLLLLSLPECCFFNVISIGHKKFHSFFEKSQKCSPINIEEAIKKAQKMTAKGGTHIYEALEWKKKKDLRIFSIGINIAVSHHFIDSIVRAGKGYAEYVSNSELMNRKAVLMLRNSLNPPIADYKITWTNESNEESQSSNTKFQQAPLKIPELYVGVRFIVYCILAKDVKSCKKIILESESKGPLHILDPIPLKGSKIHTVAAKKLIQEIEHGNYYPNHVNNKEYISEQIVHLAKSYNLSSKYTSFIAFEMQNIEDNEKKKQEIMKTMAIEKYKKIDTQDLFRFKNEHEKSLIIELEKQKEIENKKDADLKKIYEKKIMMEFEKESENQITIEIEKKECEKTTMIKNHKELQRKMELKKEQLKKENVIESQKKAEIHKKQLKKENVIEKAELQIKQHKLLDCADHKEIDIPIDVIPVVKKETRNKKLKSPESEPWWKTGLTLSYLNTAAPHHKKQWEDKDKKAHEYLSDQIKDSSTEKELLDCTDKYVDEKVTKKVKKDHKKYVAITIVQDAASPDKCRKIVSKQKDDGSIELYDSVCKELEAPKEDIITTIKKKITNEKLKLPEHSTSLSTAINLSYLKNAVSKYEGLWREKYNKEEEIITTQFPSGDFFIKSATSTSGVSTLSIPFQNLVIDIKRSLFMSWGAVKDGTKAIVAKQESDINQDDHQLWSHEDGWLINKQTNLCLEVESVKEEIYLSVHHKRRPNQANNQRWILTPEGRIALKNNPSLWRVIRIELISAKDLRNIDSSIKGKCYVRVFNEDKEIVARTNFIDNNLNPIWNEVHYLPVKKFSDKFLLDLSNLSVEGQIYYKAKFFSLEPIPQSTPDFLRNLKEKPFNLSTFYVVVTLQKPNGSFPSSDKLANLFGFETPGELLDLYKSHCYEDHILGINQTAWTTSMIMWFLQCILKKYRSE
ncbi:von willebrand domain-containing protein [Gigaspora margarita]|uniref:von willebrand domain-containing protein n=1 Tax=Gigaspora margarita TaxID=4874 RepID=A0A8H4B5W2_GIGMA|nr:von willebrand domain-containing protein [Gigaspora margarita]